MEQIQIPGRCVTVPTAIGPSKTANSSSDTAYYFYGEYRDALIHVEFKCPDMPECHGQDKGNSGVYVHGCYEVQVLDSYGIEKPICNDCSAIYCVYTPLTNACLPPEQWQTYDIILRAPVTMRIMPSSRTLV